MRLGIKYLDTLISGPNTVAKMAIAIPTIPNQTPLLAFSWLLKPPRERINNTLEPIYAAVTNSVLSMREPLNFSETWQAFFL